jgi:hypothetical protein
MANMRKNRKSNRKTRRASRRSARRNQYGGSDPAPVDYLNKGPMDLNLAQGQQYLNINKNFHGGAFYGSPYPGTVENSGLPAELQASAHMNSLNASFRDIQGLKDGGGRRKGRKGRKTSRKTKKSKKSKKSRKASRKNRKASRKVRRYRGGALGNMPLDQFSKMLLPAGLEKSAGLNPEWKLAEDPKAFAPY